MVVYIFFKKSLLYQINVDRKLTRLSNSRTVNLYSICMYMYLSMYDYMYVCMYVCMYGLFVPCSSFPTSSHSRPEGRGAGRGPGGGGGCQSIKTIASITRDRLYAQKDINLICHLSTRSLLLYKGDSSLKILPHIYFQDHNSERESDLKVKIYLNAKWPIVKLNYFII